MTVTENLGALGSWTISLDPATPKGVLASLGYFGHLAVFRGAVDVSASSDTTLLRGARYVGVLTEKASNGRVLSGAGMLLWLGDQDHKGKVIETKLVLTARTLTQCLTAVLPPAVTLGVVHDPGGTYTGTHQWQTPRDALDIICPAFGVEYRVNGDGTLDVGTPAQLYNTAAPTSIISATGTGADLDVHSLGGTLDPDITVVDYTTRVVLLGQSTDAAGGSTSFAEAAVNAPSVPYLDIHGNPVQMTRMVSDSGQTSSSVTAAAQLNLNRFNRTTQVLTVTAQDYETAGTFAVGDNAYVYDPDNGIYDPATELTFRGEVIHPVPTRISGLTWPVTYGHTVAFRAQDGTWTDLTRWVAWETGTSQITVGDLPKTLTSSSNPAAGRQDAAPDSSTPNAPTGLVLASASMLDAKGKTSSTITASWTAPTLNTDGSVIQDLGNYLVRLRVTGATAWDGRVTTDTTMTIGGLAGGISYDVEVCAVDLAGNVSAPTAVSAIITVADSIAPNAPSDPVVSSYLGQLRVYWDGKDNLGAGMPSDFNFTEVHVSATAGFTPSATTLVSQLSAAGAAYATAPYAATRYVKLVSLDTSGNRSPASNQISGATVQVADSDIATLSVGKLTAGTIGVDVVVGGRFTTALTGARTEVNSVGLQAWDAGGNQTINLNGTANLLTGTFKTALTGRRIEIGASGATGELAMYSASGVKSRLSSITVGSAEALVMGIPITGATGTDYNHIEVDSTELISLFSSNVSVLCGANGRTGAGGFTVIWSDDKRVTTDIVRLDIAGTGTTLNSENGTSFIQLTDANGFVYSSSASGYYLQSTTAQTMAYFNTHGSAGFVDQTAGTAYSPKVQMSAGTGYAAAFRALLDGTNGLVIEAESWDQSSYCFVRAQGFYTMSEASTKAEIVSYGGDALAAITGTPVRSYRRLHSHGRRLHDPDTGLTAADRVEVGLLRHEAPEQIQAGESIDLYQMSALEWRAIQQLAARVDALEGHKKQA